MTAPAKHSRRDVLKKSAVAGAVFWAVPVIESVTARAAAASNCLNGQTFQASFVWVVFTINGGSTYYFAGIKNPGTFDQGSSPGGTKTCGSNTFVLPAFSGASHFLPVTVNGTNATYFEAAGGSPPACPGGGVITNPGSGNSPNNLTVVTTVGGLPVCSYLNAVSSGGTNFTVSAANGASIAVFFVFQGGTLTPLCGPGTGCFS